MPKESFLTLINVTQYGERKEGCPLARNIIPSVWPLPEGNCHATASHAR